MSKRNGHGFVPLEFETLPTEDQLARGDDPQEIVRRIADYRAQDKAYPQCYAQHTVTKAQLQTQLEAGHSRPTGIDSIPTNDRSRDQ